MKEIKEALLDFIFPSHCLCCEQNEVEKEKLLCPSCSELLELVDPQDRCPRCFRKGMPCKICASAPSFWTFAYATEKIGPASSLWSAHPSCKTQIRVDAMTALMAVQYYRLRWPLPDAILASPIGGEMTQALAESISSYLEVPYWKGPCKRLFGSYYFWRQRCNFSSKVLLVIEGEHNLEEREYLFAIEELAAKQIYLLAFCAQEIL